MSRDERDMRAPSLNERACGEVTALAVVGLHVVDGGVRLGVTVYAHDGDGARDGVRGNLRAARDADDAVHELGVEQAEVLVLARRVLRGVADKDGVALLEEAALELKHHAREPLVADVRHNDPDGARPRAAQAARRHVRDVTALVDEALHALARLLREAAVVVDDARHGGNGDAGPLGDISDGDVLLGHGWPFGAACVRALGKRYHPQWRGGLRGLVVGNTE